MKEIRYIDRDSGIEKVEKVYGQKALTLAYGEGIFSKIFYLVFVSLTAKLPFISKFYGWLQKRSSSRKKVEAFIQNFQIDISEFERQSFSSFNDFFTRKLEADSRPVCEGEDIAVLPADGRYLVFPKLDEVDGFIVKGKRFSLEEFLKNSSLAKQYEKGAMVIARLCPVDYHRFHFPVEGKVGASELIGGYLHSVNPIALKKNIKYLSENKRYITKLESEVFGKVLFIEVGATFVGSVKQTYLTESCCKKGEEKGYFEFGGSCIIMLFEEGKIEFDQDLVEASSRRMEVLGKMGQSLGKAIQQSCK